MKKMLGSTKVITLILMALVLAVMPLAGAGCSSDDSNAKFTTSVESGDAPLEVTFTDESKGDPVSWERDFGDRSPVSTEQNPTHTFLKKSDGITVTLTVTDADGETDTETVTIITTGVNYPEMEIIFQAPFATSDVTSLVADKFAELLDQYTGGQVTLKMFYAEQLVKRGLMFEGLQSHTLQGALINSGDCRAYDSNLDFSGQLQGLVISAEHGEKVYQSEEYITFIKNQWDSHDIHYVGYVPTFLIFNYFALDEIDSLWDLEGTKLYLGKEGTLDPANKLLGTSEQAWVLPWDLEAGVNSGAVTSQATPPGLALSLFSSQKAFDHTLLRPFYNVNVFVFDNDKWDDMPGELQALIEDVIMPEVKEYADAVDADSQRRDIQNVLDEMSTVHVETCKEEEEIWQELKDYGPFLDLVEDMNTDIYDLFVELRPEYTDFDPIVKEILDQLTFNGAPIEYATGYEE